jgi:peptidoglycan/LPS O-acetylase OafA/YrhL
MQTMTSEVAETPVQDLSAEAHARAQTASHTPALDGVRGIAILLVLLMHLGAIMRSNAFIRAAFGVGWIGVDLFFVLSGFLITRIVIATREDSRYYRRFYIRRGLRIWPLYLVYVLVIYSGLHLLAHIGAVQHLAAESVFAARALHLSRPLIVYLLFIQNLVGFNDMLGLTWSLCIEEHFYLIWPLLVRRFLLGALKKALWVALAMSPLLRLALLLYWQAHRMTHGDYFSFINQVTPFHLDSIVAGCLLGIYWTEAEWPARLRRRFLLLLICGFLASVFCISLMPYSEIVCSFTFSALAILFAGVVGMVLLGWNQRILVNPLLRYFGKISYGFYLIHYPVVGIFQSHTLLHRLFPLHNVFLMELAGAVCATVVSLCLASASWKWFEKPVLGWKRRLAP